VAVTLSVLLLSAAGVYAMTSFTVARRRREIGIRTALGAAPRRLLASIFARAGAQLGGGVLAGLVVAAALDRAMGGGPFAGKGMLFLPLVAGFMVLVGLLAAVGPARRGLAVQPTEALRED
jgi:ABC-type antimicrobial peptide transport system permease subunit